MPNLQSLHDEKELCGNFPLLSDSVDVPKSAQFKFPNTNQISLVCIPVKAPLAVDDLYEGDGCLLQSNYHPKWPGRGVVRQGIMRLLWAHNKTVEAN